MVERTWDELRRGHYVSGETIEIEGFMHVVDLDARQLRFLFTARAQCCLECVPRESDQGMEVFMRAPLESSDHLLRLRGVLTETDASDSGFRLALREATLIASRSLDDDLAAPGKFSTQRRRFLSASVALSLAACAEDPPATIAAGAKLTARQIIDAQPTVDMHSHAGSVIPARDTRDPELADQRPFVPLAAPMREGGLAIVCLAVVADTPVTRDIAGHIKAVRDPAPGELYTWAQMAYERVNRLIDGQALGHVTDAGSLKLANASNPAAIVASEGADFLEGHIERLDEFYRRFGLRHLQLTHYRVNELGDIQTEPEQHGGLTDFGAEVIRRCNSLGIVVDVAHGPFSLVKRAASVTSKPLVLSHTSLALKPGPFSRTISPEHAKLVAETGGVIGIWPPVTRFADLRAMAEGMARMSDVVGVDHVGLGTDQLGLTSASVLPSYADLPKLADQLLVVGFQPQEVGKILGGNYIRVFLNTTATMFD